MEYFKSFYFYTFYSLVNINRFNQLKMKILLDLDEKWKASNNRQSINYRHQTDE